MTNSAVDTYVAKAGDSRYRRFLVHALADATVVAVVLLHPVSELPAWFRPVQAKAEQVASVDIALARITRLSGLSNRQLAPALAVTHPTVAAMRRGGGTHGAETVRRVRDLDDCVVRVAALIGDERPQVIRDALTRQSGHPPASPLDLLTRGFSVSDAYRQLLRSRRQEPATLRDSDRTRRASDSITALET